MKLKSLLAIVINQFQKIIFSLFFLPLIFINIFTTFKIGRIKTSKLGHLVLDTIAFNYFLKNFGLKSKTWYPMPNVLMA